MIQYNQVNQVYNSKGLRKCMLVHFFFFFMAYLSLRKIIPGYIYSHEKNGFRLDIPLQLERLQ